MKSYDNYFNNRRSRDGFGYRCKDCDRLLQRDYQLQIKFGITKAEYDLMRIEQKFKCAICNQIKKGKDLAVDHDHSSNKIRGLLCATCNKGLGLFYDNKTLLRNAITYLEKYND